MKQVSKKTLRLITSRANSREKLLDDLYRKHGHAMAGFIRQRTLGTDDDPEEIVQEVFSKLASQEGLLRDMEQDLINRRPYLFSMANNLLIDIRRKQQVRRKYQESEKNTQVMEDEEVRETPENLAVMEDHLQVFKHTLAKIKPVWRQAFLLYRFQYKSYREVAEHMGLTIKQVEYFVTQTLTRLKTARDRLEREGDK